MGDFQFGISVSLSLTEFEVRLELILSFLSNTLICLALDGKSLQNYPINVSISQGSILGPTLFQVNINDLAHICLLTILLFLQIVIPNLKVISFLICGRNLS